MQYKIFLIFSAVLTLFSSPGSTNAEEIEKINLRSAVDQALNNNLNMQLRREDVNSAEGATLAAEGIFDILIEGEASVQSEELTPIAIGGAEREDTSQWSAEASKLFTTGTSIVLGWNNSRYKSDGGNLFIPFDTGTDAFDEDTFLINPSYNTGLTLGLRQPLLRGFGQDVQTAAIRSTQKQLEAATYQVNSEAANLAAEVKIAYWNLVFAWQDIEVQKLALTLAKKLLDETKAKINAGRLAEVEIYQPQSEVARREEQLISAERAIGTAEDELKLLLNSDRWPTTFQPTDLPATEPVQLDLAAIENNALKSRPDIKAADLLAQAAKLDTKRAKDDILPDLALIGGVGFAGTSDTYGDSIDNSLRDPDNLWQVGVSFSMPLQNRIARGNYRQAKASYNRAITNAELLRQQIRRAVRTTVRDVQLAIKALEATQKTSLAMLKSLEAEQAKFASGRSTTLDVLTAQEAYSQALSQQNLTKINYAATLAELDRIQGLVTFSSSQL
ncbi:MAG: TolC family protein [Desulforhopalus sp.]